ncbi:MAG: nucleoside diphosphate kinase regulator [Desulfobacterales bacterium]|nr:nucleoside diphosphate kinase regulator [Desulfobacterales bacterium]
MIHRTIYITDLDLRRLTSLIENALDSDSKDRECLDRLQEELDRGKVVPASEIPKEVITMNSRARLVDLDTGETEEWTLVFPENADISQAKISVLAPIGTAMLGYKVGDVFEWEVPAGKRRLKVEEIVYQPEAAGDYPL